MAGFSQNPCVRCGTLVTIALVTGSGFCPQCGLQNSLSQQGMPQQAMPQQQGMPPQQGMPQHGMPGMPGMPAGFAMPQNPFGAAGGVPKWKIAGAIGGAVALAIVAGIGNYARTAVFGAGGKGNVGFAQLGIDPKKADGDVMMTSVAGLATKWRKDAVWWGLNFSYVRPDGTMDLSQGGATVEYASLSAAKSLAKSVNSDSLKEFKFSGQGVSFNGTTGVRDPKDWADATPPAMPACGIKQLAKALSAKGLTAGKTVRITYDQQFGLGAPKEPSWRVMGEDPKIDSYFSMANCAQTK